MIFGEGKKLLVDEISSLRNETMVRDQKENMLQRVCGIGFFSASLAANIMLHPQNTRV